jgi:hypothetical protein
VGQLEKEASQTRDYCVAKNATHRAVRPDSLDFARDRLFTAQKRLFRMTIKLTYYGMTAFRLGCNHQKGKTLQKVA